MSAAVQAEAFFPLQPCASCHSGHSGKRGLLMDSARSVRAGFDQSRISEAAYCMMIFLGLLSALNLVPFNGQRSFK